MAKKPKIVTPEDKRQNNLNHALRELPFIPEPTYFFQIGDPVSIGNLTDCFICDILENGKVYEIEYTAIDNNYGNPIVRPGERMFWVWHHVRPRYLFDDHNLIKNEDLRLSYSQRDLSGLLGNMYSFGTDMNPSYQRGYVWNQDDKQLLIDSIFKNMDIGKFVFVHLPFKSQSPSYEILDGKQRLNAISEFYLNKLSYCGYFYNDMSKREQYHFQHYMISYDELDNVSEQQKIRYFLTLNRAGKVMDEKHLSKIEKMLE